MRYRYSEWSMKSAEVEADSYSVDGVSQHGATVSFFRNEQRFKTVTTVQTVDAISLEESSEHFVRTLALDNVVANIKDLKERVEKGSEGQAPTVYRHLFLAFLDQILNGTYQRAFRK